MTRNVKDLSVIQANRAKGLKDGKSASIAHKPQLLTNELNMQVLVDRHSVVADLRTLHREMSSVTPALKGFSKIYKVVGGLGTSVFLLTLTMGTG